MEKKSLATCTNGIKNKVKLELKD